MSSVEVRPFRRADRDQLADLVNAHAEAVVPGMGTSVAALLASLERQPGEPITDPWVRERATLVAESGTGSSVQLTCCATLLTSAPGRPTGAWGRSAGWSSGLRPLRRSVLGRRYPGGRGADR